MLDIYSYIIDRHTFNGLCFRTLSISQHQKGKIILNFNEARDDGGGSGISWTICKSLHLTPDMPAPHHSNFLQAGCSSWCLTNNIKELKAILFICDSYSVMAVHSFEPNN